MLRKLALMALSLLVAAAPTFAQTATGSVAVRVGSAVDGLPIPGATVSILSEGDGITVARGYTDQYGTITFGNLPLLTLLTASTVFPGFRPDQRTFYIDAGQQAILNVSMQFPN